MGILGIVNSWDNIGAGSYQGVLSHGTIIWLYKE